MDERLLRKTWINSPSVDECDGCGITAAQRLSEGHPVTVFSLLGGRWLCTACFNAKDEGRTPYVYR